VHAAARVTSDRNRRGHVHAGEAGMSVFVLADGIVHHNYSAYLRALDVLWGMYQWLDTLKIAE
jgi:predicted dithiol-disulfide oxidoreductase (DUF899 family)